MRYWRGEGHEQMERVVLKGDRVREVRRGRERIGRERKSERERRTYIVREGKSGVSERARICLVTLAIAINLFFSKGNSNYD